MTVAELKLCSDVNIIKQELIKQNRLLERLVNLLENENGKTN